MQDNFNLAKYLRHGNKLLNENIGGYVDLRPINELNDLGMTEEAKGSKASLELDWAAGIPDLKAVCKKHGLTFKVVEEFGPAGGNPLVKVSGTKDKIINFLKDDYVQDEEDLEMFSADIQEGDDSMSLEELMGTAMEIEELEKPEKIYADDEEKYDNQDRMFDLGGQQIEQGIIDLLDDGFEADEVLEMCKMFIDAHVQAAAQGNKF